MELYGKHLEMTHWPGQDNECMVKSAGRHIERIILKVKIYEENEFERMHGEGKRAKDSKRSRTCCFFIIFYNLPSFLLLSSLVDSLKVSSWPTFSNWKPLFLFLDPLPFLLAWDVGSLHTYSLLVYLIQCRICLKLKVPNLSCISQVYILPLQHSKVPPS